jgi:hypothetical protein
MKKPNETAKPIYRRERREHKDGKDKFSDRCALCVFCG